MCEWRRNLQSSLQSIIQKEKRGKTKIICVSDSRRICRRKSSLQSINPEEPVRAATSSFLPSMLPLLGRHSSAIADLWSHFYLALCGALRRSPAQLQAITASYSTLISQSARRCNYPENVHLPCFISCCCLHLRTICDESAIPRSQQQLRQNQTDVSKPRHRSVAITASVSAQLVDRDRSYLQRNPQAGFSSPLLFSSTPKAASAMPPDPCPKVILIKASIQAYLLKDRGMIIKGEAFSLLVVQQPCSY